MELARKKFQGVLNILSFNRHFYVFGLSFIILLIISRYIFNWNPLLFWSIAVGFGYGLVIPLIVSAYIYDFSGYYEMNWLKKLDIQTEKIKKIVTINAGFDETSFLLKNKFPNADLQVFDFYNAEKHTEPAIVRARKVSLVYPNTRQIASNDIPLKENSVDLIFLLSAVHEIRSNTEKIMFLKECRRICKPNGKVIIIEHLRDVPNFFAFSIGFTHFFSQKTWLKVISQAGFKTIKEFKFTPFMSILESKP